VKPTVTVTKNLLCEKIFRKTPFNIKGSNLGRPRGATVYVIYTTLQISGTEKY